MDFAITINSNSPVPLHQQLYEELRQAILHGRLLPGGRIPSTRQLAKSLGISRTTVRKMRAVYDKRRQVLVKAFNMNFGEKATILGEKAGIHLMVRLQTPFSDEEIMQRAERAGIGIMSAAPHYLRPHSKGEFIFGYGELTEQQLVEGVDRLGQSLNNNSY